MLPSPPVPAATERMPFKPREPWRQPLVPVAILSRIKPIKEVFMECRKRRGCAKRPDAMIATGGTMFAAKGTPSLGFIPLTFPAPALAVTSILNWSKSIKFRKRPPINPTWITFMAEHSLRADCWWPPCAATATEAMKSFHPKTPNPRYPEGEFPKPAGPAMREFFRSTSKASTGRP